MRRYLVIDVRLLDYSFSCEWVCFYFDTKKSFSCFGSQISSEYFANDGHAGNATSSVTCTSIMNAFKPTSRYRPINTRLSRIPGGLCRNKHCHHRNSVIHHEIGTIFDTEHSDSKKGGTLFLYFYRWKENKFRNEFRERVFTEDSRLSRKWVDEAIMFGHHSQGNVLVIRMSSFRLPRHLLSMTVIPQYLTREHIPKEKSRWCCSVLDSWEKAVIWGSFDSLLPVQ